MVPEGVSVVSRDREQVRRDILSFLGEDPEAELARDEFRVGEMPLEELTRMRILSSKATSSAAAARAWEEMFSELRSRGGSTAEAFAREYSRIASEVPEKTVALVIPEPLQSPQYTFGLETRTYVLWFERGTQPRRYTVCSRGGEILAEGIEHGELERRFPEFAGFERLGESDLIDY